MSHVSFSLKTLVLATFSTFLGSIGFLQIAQAAETVTIVGAGSTFVYPAISRWAELYKTQTGHIVNYQSIGSGAGIRQIKEKTIDFGATDKPLKKEELDKLGLVQFPVIIGGVVPVVNLEGIQPGQIKLTGTVLADIFLGKIKRWNEKSIADLNPSLKLPDTLISVVHRADGSGTTFLFTHYLSQISADWKNSVGEDAAVAWKTGIGAKGNEGVTAYIQRQKGSIGYIEFAYAKKNQLSYTLLQNAAGTFATPDDTTFAAAASHAKWNAANAFYEILTNEPGQTSWPITGATFVLLYKEAAEPKKSETTLGFFDWALHKGQQEATKLDFVPLPASVATTVKQSWSNIHIK